MYEIQAIVYGRVTCGDVVKWDFSMRAGVS